MTDPTPTADRRTCLNSNHVARKNSRLAPRVLFPILRYLQGAINKLLPGWTRAGEGGVWKEPNAEEDPQMKSLLKVCGPAYSSAMRGFRIIPGSTTRGPSFAYAQPPREKFTNTPQPIREWSASDIARDFYTLRSAEFYYCYMYKKWLKRGLRRAEANVPRVFNRSYNLMRLLYA